MSRITWDGQGEKRYETGVRNGVLYLLDGASYGVGHPWNGLTGVTVSPEGADATDLYADDIKYLTMRSAENVKATIEAYTYPDEWAECDGSAWAATGVKIGQQPRSVFGFCWRTVIGNDVQLDNYGYIIHILWGCTAAPSEKAYQTINDSPEAITLSWEISSNPISVGESFRPTAYMEIDSTKADSTLLASLLDILYGDNSHNSSLPMPADIIAHFAGSATSYTYEEADPVGTENPSEEGWYVRMGNDFILSTDTAVVGGTVYYVKTPVT